MFDKKYIKKSWNSNQNYSMAKSQFRLFQSKILVGKIYETVDINNQNDNDSSTCDCEMQYLKL